MSETLAQRASDWLVDITGSWACLALHTVGLLVWTLGNSYWICQYWRHQMFDPYPWLLLNLLLSVEAAMFNPVLLMSARRQNDRDRVRDDQDHERIQIVLSHIFKIEE